jgi:hypothetical protein
MGGEIGGDDGNNGNAINFSNTVTKITSTT